MSFETPDRAHRLNLGAAFASVAVAVLLILMKLGALVATGALSVAASLVDSALDLVASLAALVAIRYAAKPPDADHSFGHSSIEDLVALGQAVIVAVSAIAIGWNGVRRLGAPQELAAEGLGMAVMAFAIAVTVALVLWQGHVARRTGSKVVAADRMHYIADLYPNLGALVALWAASSFGILWLDPVVALVACALILWGARRIGLDAWHALMDREASSAVVARVAGVLDRHPGLAGWHELRTRTAGARVFVQVHVEIDGALTLREAHEIAAALRREIIAAVPQADVIIHQDPA